MKNLLISFLCVLIIALQVNEIHGMKKNVTVNYSQLAFTHTHTHIQFPCRPNRAEPK